MIAVFWLAVGGMDQVANMTPVQKLGSFRDLKSRLQMAARGIHPPVPKVAAYPDDPADFKTMMPSVYNKVYSKEPPATSQLSVSDIAQVVHEWPARSTNAQVSSRCNDGPWNQQTLLQGPAAQAMQMQMMQMMAQMMMPRGRQEFPPAVSEPARRQMLQIEDVRPTAVQNPVVVNKVEPADDDKELPDTMLDKIQQELKDKLQKRKTKGREIRK